MANKIKLTNSQFYDPTAIKLGGDGDGASVRFISTRQDNTTIQEIVNRLFPASDGIYRKYSAICIFSFANCEGFPTIDAGWGLAIVNNGITSTRCVVIGISGSGTHPTLETLSVSFT